MTLAGRLVEAAVFAAVFWLALAGLMAALPWAPETPISQSGRIVAIIGAGAGMTLGALGVVWSMARRGFDRRA